MRNSGGVGKIGALIIGIITGVFLAMYVGPRYFPDYFFVQQNATMLEDEPPQQKVVNNSAPSYGEIVGVISTATPIRDGYDVVIDGQHFLMTKWMYDNITDKNNKSKFYYKNNSIWRVVSGE